MGEPEYIVVPVANLKTFVKKVEQLQGMLNYTTACLRGFEEENKALKKQIAIDQNIQTLKLDGQIYRLHNNQPY